ncbi:hypothetical protein [Nocardioides sp. WS12]|nr:hypothetical protein [Nocardioides sp. WS12]
MPGDEDDYEYTTTDVGPREPDRFDKRGNETRENADDRETREQRERG